MKKSTKIIAAAMAVLPCACILTACGNDDSSKTQDKDILAVYNLYVAYAEENNILVTDEEVDSYIEEIIHGCKSSEEGKVIELACSEVGTTIEDVIRGDYIRYEAMLVEQKAYDYYSNNYIERNGLEASTISETVKKQIYMDWVQFKSQM